jgi:hypothetical protein
LTPSRSEFDYDTANETNAKLTQSTPFKASHAAYQPSNLASESTTVGIGNADEILETSRELGVVDPNPDKEEAYSEFATMDGDVANELNEKNMVNHAVVASEARTPQRIIFDDNAAETPGKRRMPSSPDGSTASDGPLNPELLRAVAHDVDNSPQNSEDTPAAGRPEKRAKTVHMDSLATQSHVEDDGRPSASSSFCADTYLCTQLDPEDGEIDDGDESDAMSTAPSNDKNDRYENEDFLTQEYPADDEAENFV